jgi:hypothetical protein
MIPKSGNRFSEKIMLNESAGLDRDRLGGGTNDEVLLVFVIAGCYDSGIMYTT